MRDFSSDLRTAVRALIQWRGFTTTAVLTLAVGIALCTTVLAVINAYLIRTLPYPAADRLYTVQYAGPRENPPRNMEALDWRSLDDIVEHPIAWDLDMFFMLGGAYPEQAPGAWVTPGFVAGIGVRASLGRNFGAADFQPGSARVALISHRLWQTRFSGDRGILGRTFNAFVSDRPDAAESFTIVGVLPSDFWAQFPYTEVLAPLKAPTYPYLVRLRANVPAGVAADRISALVRSGATGVSADWRATVTSTHASYVAELRPVLVAVAVAAGLILLIACANVAVLVLLRGTRRRQELAVRVALGASQADVARLLVVEALVLGSVATAIGVGLGQYAIRVLAPMVEAVVQRRVPGGPDAFALDPALVAATIAGGLTVSVAASLLPLAALRRASLLPLLTASGRSTTEGAGPRRTRSVMVAVEVAASLTLLTGSALLVESAVRLLRQDLGIRTEHVLQGGVTLRPRAYPDVERRAALYDRLLAKLADISPGGSAALADWWPLQAPRPRRIGRATGGDLDMDAGVTAVSPGYFETFAVPVIDGRAFTLADRPGSEPVAIVSASLASRLWPGTRAIDQALRIDAPAGARANVPRATVHRVVGVVGDVRQSSGDDSLFDVYIPQLHRADGNAFVSVYAPAPPPQWDAVVRRAVAEVDPEIAMGPMRPLDALLDQQQAAPRFLALLLTTFAAFAALLALVGLYGVLAYAARQREREVAVRMALGADARSVTRLFVQQGALVLFWGLAAGLGGAVALGRLLQSQLHGVLPNEPRVLVTTTLAFAAVSLVTMWWPARRAATLDPAPVLKSE